MANSELLLLKPVEDLGNEGDQVKVKSGFARNYLLPRGFAIPVTRANRKQIEVLQKRRNERLQKEIDAAKEKQAKLETITIAIAVKTGPGGKVFGSVTAQNLVERIAEDGLEIQRKQIQMASPAKELGQHTVKVKFHPEVVCEYSFEVVSENPIEEGEGEEATAESSES